MRYFLFLIILLLSTSSATGCMPDAECADCIYVNVYTDDWEGLPAGEYRLEWTIGDTQGTDEMTISDNWARVFTMNIPADDPQGEYVFSTSADSMEYSVYYNDEVIVETTTVDLDWKEQTCSNDGKEALDTVRIELDSFQSW